MTGEIINVLLIDDDEEDYILTRALLSDGKKGKYEPTGPQLTKRDYR